MPRARDLLARFRPVGAPGTAAPAGVPVDRVAERRRELLPVASGLRLTWPAQRHHGDHERAGPRQPLYALGRRCVEIIPYVPIASRLRIGVSMFSYAGQLTCGVTGDYDTAADIWTLAEGIEIGMTELVAAATADLSPAERRTGRHARSPGACPASRGHPRRRPGGNRMTGTASPAARRAPSAEPVPTFPRSVSGSCTDGRWWKVLAAADEVTAVMSTGTVGEARVSERGEQVVVELSAGQPVVPAEVSAPAGDAGLRRPRRPAAPSRPRLCPSPRRRPARAGTPPGPGCPHRGGRGDLPDRGTPSPPPRRRRPGRDRAADDRVRRCQTRSATGCSRSTRYSPRRAAPFIAARCLRAACAAPRTSSGSPAHARSTGACSARPNEKLSSQGCGRPRFMASRFAVACLVGLTAGEEHDPGHRRRNGLAQYADRRLARPRRHRLTGQSCPGAPCWA